MDVKGLRNAGEYARRFPKSGELFAEARKYIPAGVNSTARTTWSGWSPYPLCVERGVGARLCLFLRL
jgi:glutamate-1-semialdehyde aminotransferase